MSQAENLYFPQEEQLAHPVIWDLKEFESTKISQKSLQFISEVETE